ncbi:PAS domain-containing protein [Nostoc ellipsosporum NOK]|nr:PAS domain-containing protein [Nostoc ellipsosporum NOK]
MNGQEKHLKTPDQIIAENALRESEERLRLFTAASNSIVFRVNADWSRVENLVGKELIADTPGPFHDWIDKYILPEDQQPFFAAIREAITGQSIFELEHRVKRSDGSVAWMLSRAIPLFDDQGEITEWFGTASDVHQRRVIKDALQKSEEKYRTIFETIDEGFCIFEVIYKDKKPTDLLWIEVNTAYEKQTGLKDTVGKLASEVMPGTEKHWLDIYDQVVKTGEAVHFENWHEPTDRWYNTFCSRIGKSENKQVAVLFSDVTARKRQERRQQLQLRLADGLRFISDPVAIQFEAARILGELLGAQRVAYSGIDQTAYIIERDWSNGVSSITGRLSITSFPKHIYDSLTTGQRVTYSNISNNPDFSAEETAAYAALNIEAFAAIPLMKDNTLTVLFIVMYTTTHTWTDHEIEMIEETAERTWAAVERARAEEALRKSESQLKQLVKMRDEFISIASHELKTPVTSIKAYAQIIQENLQAGGHTGQNDLLFKLNKQIDRLTTLINSLLDTTKIAEGQLKLQRESLDLNDLLTERINEIKNTSNHTFQLDLQPVPSITADRERIGQVIINLVSNAIKYSPKGTTITITSVAESNRISVSVKDEGYGIPEEDLEKIFQRFFRVKANNMDAYPGIGLGLYISQQIIHNHGGNITVQSKQGEGTVFSFTLPCNNDQC